MIDVVAAMSPSSIGGGDGAATNVPEAICRQLAVGFLRLDSSTILPSFVKFRRSSSPD
jgi:hypothetical protein